MLTFDINGIKIKDVDLKVQFILNDDTSFIDEAVTEFLAMEEYKKDEELIPNIVDGKNETKAKLLRGTHPKLRNMYGGDLARHKIWFQKEDKFYYKYEYTGYNEGLLPVTFAVKKKRHPKLWNLVKRMKKRCKQNHWIMTRYDSGSDYIPAHSDKTHTWVKNSSFHVIKYGHPRRFVIRYLDEIVFDKILPNGTEVIVDALTNRITTHEVPKVYVDGKIDQSVGLSGSIVGRHIKTQVPFDKFIK